jgi:Ca-activated chloride channel family protein
MTPRNLLAVALLVSASFTVVFAQDATFRVDVQLVRLLATVKSNSGGLVGNLEKEDFAILDSGVEQEITLFDRRTSQPLSVALLVDTSGSAATRFAEEAASVNRFVRTMLRQGNKNDVVTLYSFNHDVSLEAGFTRSEKRIAKEMRNLKAEAGTSLYDAVYFASRSLRYRKGRRVIVLVTDGADTTSIKTFQDAQEAAHSADAVLYGIMVIPVTNEAGRHIAGENALISLATGTGGRVFAASLGEMLDSAFDSILADLRTQYLIGYYPKNIPPSKDRFHRIEVRLSSSDLRAFTRTGYYGEYKDSRTPAPSRGGPSIKPRHQE